MQQTYGPTIDLETARKASAAAVVVARTNGWTMAVAVVDPAGDLVYFEKMDQTQVGSTNVAIAKARSAARFKRPTKVFEDTLASAAGLPFLALEGVVPMEGGIPLVVNGQIVGAIGVSGDARSNDGQCAQAGVAALT